MKHFLLLSAVATVLAAGCTTDRDSAANVEGARSPLANPANNTLNSPVTGPSSAGLPGGPIGSPPTPSGEAPVSGGRF